MIYRVKRVHWERHELHGMLTIDTTVPGIRTVDGRMSMGTFNLTSMAARTRLAKDLSTRAKTPELDYEWHLEELCQRVLMAEQKGRPIQQLNRIVPRPVENATRIDIHGFPLLLHHPTMLFGDGAAGKSTLALYMAGILEQRGIPTLYLDWELDEFDHFDNLVKLFGADPPDVKYRFCQRPLQVEAESLAEQVWECGIEYIVCDSVAPACMGAPETAEACQGYFRALRAMKVGSLNLAHVTKGEDSDKKPFGSAYWFNLVRSCWYLERADPIPGDSAVRLGLYQRKYNLGPVRPALGMLIDYTENRILISDGDIADNEQLASKLTLSQKLYAALRKGESKTIATLVEETGAHQKSIEKLLRSSTRFTRIPDVSGITKIALVSNGRNGAINTPQGSRSHEGANAEMF